MSGSVVGTRFVWSLPPRSSSRRNPEELGSDSDHERLLLRISDAIARIDGWIAEIIDQIVHHPRFQELEAVWRGVEYLLSWVPPGARIRIQLLNASWRELKKDFDRSGEFDGSHLFRLVYSETFGTAGGKPFGLLVGAYEIHPWPTKDHPTADLDVLGAVSEVSAAAFSPFIAAAHPSLLGLHDWAELERPVNLERIYQQTEFVRWNHVREAESMNFIGLALPRMLLRKPRSHYRDNPGLCYREGNDASSAKSLLWGNAAFAFAAVVVRCFAETNWVSAIRGISRMANAEGYAEGVAESGGLVTGLPIRYFETDMHSARPLPPTDVVLTDTTERLLSDSGFLPLTAVKDTEYCAFYSNRSVRLLRAASMDDNEIAASQLQNVLSVSRFAHFLKIIARDMIGSFADAESLEVFLNGWLRKYVNQDPNASAETRAVYPLREAVVRVREIPGRPGAYTSVVFLWPHSELDELRGSVSFTSELSPGRK